jgi:hypothetical protein
VIFEHRRKRSAGVRDGEDPNQLVVLGDDGRADVTLLSLTGFFWVISDYRRYATTDPRDFNSPLSPRQDGKSLRALAKR